MGSSIFGKVTPIWGLRASNRSVGQSLAGFEFQVTPGPLNCEFGINMDDLGYWWYSRWT